MKKRTVAIAVGIPSGEWSVRGVVLVNEILPLVGDIEEGLLWGERWWGEGKNVCVWGST